MYLQLYRDVFTDGTNTSEDHGIPTIATGKPLCAVWAREADIGSSNVIIFVHAMINGSLGCAEILNGV